MGNESKIRELSLPSPTKATASAAAGDVRAVFAAITKRTPRDKQAENAFLASKFHMVRTHPMLNLAARKTLAATLTKGLKKTVAGSAPVPGGVGYGMFYD